MNDRTTRKTMVLSALLLAVAACSGTDNTLASSDVTDLTASAYRSVAVTTVKIDPTNATVAVGSTVKLGINLYDSQGRRITGMGGVFARWTSSDSTVATVSSNGSVAGLSNGVVTIKAISGSAVGEATVTVGTGAPTTVVAAPTAPTTTTTTTSTTTSTTTAPTTTTTTPTTTSTSSGTGVSAAAFVKDDFTGYASTAALQANITSNAGGTGSQQTALYTDGINVNLVELDRTTLYNGHPTMKYVQPGGTGATPWLGVGFPQPLTHIWYRVKVRFSPGWTDTGTLTNSANAYKLLSWGWNGANGSGRLEITNTNQYDFYWNVQSLTDGSLIGGGNHATAGNITGEWTTGGWYDYIIEVDHSAGTSGVARVWMAPDGQVPVLKATVPGTMLSGGALPLLTGVSVGLNFNQVRTATQSQAIWWGQWEVVDGTQHSNPFNVH